MITTQTINTTDSLVNFQVKKLGFMKVSGTISGMQGQISFDPQNLDASNFDVSVELASINTESAKRDDHLKQADFFDVANHPQISFKSSRVMAVGSGYKAVGILTIRGIAKEVALPFEYKNNRFEGNLELNRADFQVGKLPGFIVSKKIAISITCVMG